MRDGQVIAGSVSARGGRCQRDVALKKSVDISVYGLFLQALD